MIRNQRCDCRQYQRLEIRQIRFDANKCVGAIDVRFMLEIEMQANFTVPQPKRTRLRTFTKLITEIASVSMSMPRSNALFCKMLGNSFNTSCTIVQSVSVFRHSMIILQLRRIGIVDSVSAETITWGSGKGTWPPTNDDGCCWTVENMALNVNAQISTRPIRIRIRGLGDRAYLLRLRFAESGLVRM